MGSRPRPLNDKAIMGQGKVEKFSKNRIYPVTLCYQLLIKTTCSHYSVQVKCCKVWLESARYASFVVCVEYSQEFGVEGLYMSASIMNKTEQLPTLLIYRPIALNPNMGVKTIESSSPENWILFLCKNILLFWPPA
jgi:hypothetical protein